MPKIDIDYSNTIIYKIVCRNKAVTDMYIGYTTNFVQRKYMHKQCSRTKMGKLYEVIRKNGGWENWQMEMITTLNCEDQNAAIKKEHEYVFKMQATLNNEEPSFSVQQHEVQEHEVQEHEVQENTIQKIKYNCEFCKFKCLKKNNFEQHLLTAKHQMNSNTPLNTKKFVCVCGKDYNYRQGLYIHKKKCDVPKNDISSCEVTHLTNLVIELVNNNKELQKQNKEFQNEIMVFHKHNNEIQKQMIDVCKNTTTTNNIQNNNNNNKTFNMQVFLNEQCKDAMNIMDFVNSMTLELSDLEDVGELGYVEGISKIIIRKLNELDVCKRPIHCSDFKREIMYVKDMDIWSKENSTFDKIRKAIKYVTKKNGDLLIPWIQKYPTGMNIQHPHNDIYMRIMNQAMGGRESFVESENKIIKKISKAVQIDKKYNKCQ
jgi:hypothetical protein